VTTLAELIETTLGLDAPAGPARVEALVQVITDLGDDVDLAQLETDAAAQFEALYRDGDYDPADVPTCEALADIVDAVKQVRASVDTDTAERDQHVASLADRVRSSDPAAGGAGEGVDDSEGSGGLAESPDASGDAGEGQDGGDGVDEPPADDDTQSEGADTSEGGSGGSASAPAAVAASSRPSPARRPSTAAAVRGRTAPRGGQGTQPARRPLRRFTVTASAEVPEFPYGQQLTMSQLGEASVARFMSLPVGTPASAPIKVNVAKITRHFDPSITLSGDQSDTAILDRIADEKRLPGGSLVAAVQDRTKKALTAAVQAPSVTQDIWCTPSETDYTLCPSLATDEGIADFPTAAAPRRGGIRFPVWSQYPEQAADATRNNYHGYAVQYPANPADPGVGLDNPNYFHRNVAQGGDASGLGNTKKCISGPCVSWREVRESIAYLCVESDILRDRTFPEGIARFADDVLLHHQHYLNELQIAYVQASADPLPAFSVTDGAGSIGSVTDTVAQRLGLLIAWLRSAYKMGRAATLELMLPDWFLEYLKSDIARHSNRTYGAVSDAEVNAIFAQYTSRVQWLKDWQELGNGAAVGGRIMPPTSWPTAVQILAFPAGSWVRTEANVLTLGVQYDYSLLKENRYSASFTEDSWMMLNRCNRTFTIALTDLCNNGAVGPQRDACPIVVSGASVASTGLDADSGDTENTENTENTGDSAGADEGTAQIESTATGGENTDTSSPADTGKTSAKPGGTHRTRGK
jgi:hypothetical protein